MSSFLREDVLKKIDPYIDLERYSQIDPDYFKQEVIMASYEDLHRIQASLSNNLFYESNPHNSILLYLTKLTDDFDFNKARSNTTGGAPPDVDLDHDALDREKAIQWCIDYWGRERVANIITHGTFKPKSLARSYYRITEKDQSDLNDLLAMVPPPKYGKEATLEEILEQNPNISEEQRYAAFLEFADRIEDMVANFGIHAAGVIISDTEISDNIPIWSNSKADRITQYDKDECEDLGLLKFDFLGIDTLSVIKECTTLIEEQTGEKIEPYAIQDGDELAYKYLNEGCLTGIFQMETSGTAKKLILDIKPQSIEDLSAISAINRPGPLQAGLDKTYITNKLNNSPPEDLPENVAEILKASYWTLIYQEQIMRLFTDLAGFTQQEADDVRRAMGKKKLSVLEKYKEQFLAGATSVGGLMADYADSLWNDILGFADYCLAGDTEILLPIGTERSTKIKDIIKDQYNGFVLSYDTQVNSWSGESPYCAQHISQWHDKGIKDVYRYVLEDGSYVDCTENHSFLLSNKKSYAEIDKIYTKKLEIYSTKDD